MTILIPALAIAFAAVCIWLMVRIINRKERWAKWTLAVTALFLPVSTYVFAYLSVVRAVVPDHWSGYGFSDRPTIIPLMADYSGKVSEFDLKPPRNQATWERFFAPVHAIDREIRPRVWKMEFMWPDSAVTLPPSDTPTE
jgi:hypothetical protein